MTYIKHYTRGSVAETNDPRETPKPMKLNRNAGILFTIVILAAFVLVNVWASHEANHVSPGKEAALAVVGTVDDKTHRRSEHLTSAQDGFYLLRAWHWWRYTSLSNS